MKTTLGYLKVYRYNGPFSIRFQEMVEDKTEKITIDETGQEMLLDDGILEQLITSNSEDMVVDYSGEMALKNFMTDEKRTVSLVEDFKYFLYLPLEREYVCLIRNDQKDTVKVASSPEVAQSYIDVYGNRDWDYVVAPILFEV